MNLVGLFPIMIGMMMMIHPLADGGDGVIVERLRDVGAWLRRHFPVTRDDRLFDPLIDRLDE